jgi:hypothetical protein
MDIRSTAVAAAMFSSWTRVKSSSLMFPGFGGAGLVEQDGDPAADERVHQHGGAHLRELGQQRPDLRLDRVHDRALRRYRGGWSLASVRFTVFRETRTRRAMA